MAMISAKAAGQSIAWPTPLQIFSAINRFFVGSIPEVSARTLAVYRLTFGILFLLFWIKNASPQALSDLRLNGPKHWANSFEPIVYLASSQMVTDLTYYAVIILSVALIAGVLSRITYPLLVAAFWLAVLFMNQNHFMTPLLLAITAAAPARWSDDLSLDRLLGIARPIQARSRLYGYPIWLMGLCIALAYTAAGFSKLVMTDGAWLWSTGSRWGFVVDLHSAVTDFGLLFVNNYWLAFLASAFASFGQIIYLYSCFTRSIWIKTAIGVFIAIPFLIGLVLFMGLFWWPWALLVILLYIPWGPIGNRLDRLSCSSLPPAPLSDFSLHARWALCATWLLLLGHGYVVFAKKGAEYEPIVSNFDMYAIRFPMGSDFELSNWKQFASYERHFVPHIEAVMPSGDKIDFTNRFRLADFLSRVGLYTSPIISLKGRDVWQYVDKSEPLSEGLCADLRAYFEKHGGVLPARIVYGKRYHDLVDGRFEVVDVDETVIVEVSEPTCPYTRSAGRALQEARN